MAVPNKDVNWQRILEGKSSGALKQLIEAAQELMAERELHKVPPRRKVVERRRGNQGVEYQLEMVECGQPCCRKDQENEGHGPYWYAYFYKNGQVISKFLGTRIPDELQT